MEDKKQKAIALRKQGKSYSEINVILEIPKSTLSYWLKEISIPPVAKKKLMMRSRKKTLEALIRRNKKQTVLAEERAWKIRKENARQIHKIDTKTLFWLGVALYWAEGYKKGAEGSAWKCVDFANSDSHSLQIMMRFFREICNVPEDKFRVQIILHKNVSEAQAKEYWSELLGISKKQFIKSSNPTYTSQGKRRNLLKYGTVHIRVYDVNLFHKLIGWIDGVKKNI